MAIEEEFGIEIPDAEADEITTVAQGKSCHDLPHCDKQAESLELIDSAIDYVEKVCSDGTNVYLVES